MTDPCQQAETAYQRDYKRKQDLLWWSERDQGKLEEMVRHVEIEAGRGLKIDTGEGVVAEYKKTGNLEASLYRLSKSPWVGELRHDPDLAGKRPTRSPPRSPMRY